MKFFYKIIIVAMLVSSTQLFAQKFKDLALTPPMGWNSWNTFACNVDETLIRGMADAMVATGMKDAGYTYIVIDDCWQGVRDSLGFIHPDPKRFPSGIKALADYIHSKGLKFGIYSCAGINTCGGYPASRGHEYQDAITYASWGADYLKYDWCNTDGLSAVGAYTTMSMALTAAGRPVVFSLCEWGNNKPWLWAKDVGHLWRTTGDIYRCWNCELNYGTWTTFGVTKIIDMQTGLREYAGPGHWNDPDMLEVGNGMTVNEDRAHFSMWCMLAAPLIAGNDLRNLSKETNSILTNKEVIAIDQDSLGVQGFRQLNFGDLEVWAKPLKNDEVVVCFFNRGDKPRKIEHDWKKYGMQDGFSKMDIKFDKKVYNVRDLWLKKDVGTTDEIFKAEVPAHDVVMVRLSK